MEREEKMEESIEKKWKRILSPFRRYCGNCHSHFGCTGDCPEGRWKGSGRQSTRDGNSDGTCFCKKCLIETNFVKEYKDGRISKCYWVR